MSEILLKSNRGRRATTHFAAIVRWSHNTLVFVKRFFARHSVRDLRAVFFTSVAVSFLASFLASAVVLVVASAVALVGMPVHNVAAGDAVFADRSDGGMVVSDSAVASQIGRDMLAQGGSAVDAAVATAFALAVAWPDAGNIGGGGFMLVHRGDGGDPICIDYREVAPSAMTSTSYTEDDTTFTQKAVGVPGTVRGLAKAHALLGRLQWKQVVMPAAQLAQNGVPVDQPLADSLNRVLRIDAVKSNDKYAELVRVYGKPGGQSWQDGDLLVLPDLARTLTEIAEQGPDAFYRGRIADLIVQEMRGGDGLISKQDLRDYAAAVRPAMRGTYRGYTILGAPPPSSGGTCVIQALNILENFDLRRRDRFDPENIHLITEALKRAFADRAKHLGDPDFVEIPPHLTEKDYAKRLADSISRQHATRSEDLLGEIELADESPDTTHFSVVDAQGMAVSNTYTLEASWGSRIVVRNAGFVLNNEMGDFNWFPGRTNRRGRIGTAANLIEPGKRMLSSQSPTIVLKDGRPVVITGSPGGRTIISTVLCVLVNTIDFRMDLSSAIAAPRLHHQWFPDVLELEQMQTKPHSDVYESIRRKRHVIKHRNIQGSAHSIAWVPRLNQWVGVADYRRGGRPAGLGASTVALWEFLDPPGTELTEARGYGDYRWSSDIDRAMTDGQGHLRIRNDSPTQPMQSYLDLTGLQRPRLAVELAISGATFAGHEANEELRVSFVHGTVNPRMTAQMVFGRSQEQTITLRGEASGRGTSIDPHIICNDFSLDGPIVVRLEVDTNADTYRIASRPASAIEFTYHGTGRVAPDLEANYIGLNPRNDYASESEYIDVDRIEVLEDQLK